MPNFTGTALTYDDVLIKPGYSEVLPSQVNLATRVSRNISLNIPLISAAMDTVTESRMAIAMAQLGGIGVIHKNMSPTDQAAQVRKVKKYESGIVRDPVTIRSDASVAELVAETQRRNVSGMPVVDDGVLKGIVTARDFRHEKNQNASVQDIMTPYERLITVDENASQEEIYDKLHKHRLEKLLVVGEVGALLGLVTLRDIENTRNYPDASKNELGQLLVAAAIGNAPDYETRLHALVEAGVDLLVVDSAHGHSKGVLDCVTETKKRFPNIDVVGGNIATSEGAKALVSAGADAVKVGIGPGSICTTRIVTGVGVPQITAIAEAAEGLEVPVIADGGVRFSGDLAKGIGTGAHCIMLGSLLAGSEEAPGEIELYQGRTYKSYRGMGSLGAMAKFSSERYFQSAEEGVAKLVPEGIEGRVPYKGKVAEVIYQLLGGLRSSMGYTGCESIDKMRQECQFVQVTSAGVIESHVHDVSITKEAPNYGSHY